MKRKDFIKSTGLGIAAIAGSTSLLSSCQSETSTEVVNTPNIHTRKTYHWRMTTVWGKNFPVFGEAANLLSEWVDVMSNGRFKIKIYGAGELVPGLEAFDTTSMGITDMGAGAAYYWQGKIAASPFFAAVPFGMNAQQVTAWLIGGDQEGYSLWKEAYAPFDLIPFLSGNSGVQMAGWFNKEINAVEDLRGLKMRIPGLAGKALEKAGGAAINVAPGEIYTNLERGVIDATEWVGPYHDYKLGFHKVAKYYYTPGWHEAGTQLEFFANKKACEKLPRDLQEILYTASLRVQAWVLAEFEAKNGLYLNKLIDEHNVQIKDLPDEVLDTLYKYSQESIQELIEDDPLSKKVYQSYTSFQNKLKKWSSVTEKAYYNRVQR